MGRKGAVPALDHPRAGVTTGTRHLHRKSMCSAPKVKSA